jgi:phage shock protein PspC (stress-responsive transcriptional regulator)
MKEGISRSRQNRILGGVAAGLAEYLSIDAIVVRVLFVVSVLFSGIGVLLYLIMWMVIPEERFEPYSNINDNGVNNSNNTENANDINFTITQNKKNDGKVVFGIILIVVGFFFLGIEVFSFINFKDLIPILLVGAGIYLVWNSKSKRG